MKGKKTRLAQLKDRMTQMGHEPSQYEAWAAEIKSLEESGITPKPRKVTEVVRMSSQAVVAKQESLRQREELLAKRMDKKAEAQKAMTDRQALAMEHKTRREQIRAETLRIVSANHDRVCFGVLLDLVQAELGEEEAHRLCRKAREIAEILIDCKGGAA